jgi:CBS domain-containing protein
MPSVAGDTNIRRVTMVLLETGLPGLRVVDEHGTVTGSISRSDILRAGVADPPLELCARA